MGLNTGMVKGIEFVGNHLSLNPRENHYHPRKKDGNTATSLNHSKNLAPIKISSSYT